MPILFPLLFLLSLISPNGFAADVPAATATKPETVEAQKNLPITLQADRLEGHSNLDVEASGRVELQQGDMKLNTDRLYFLEPEQEVIANGAVHFEKEGDIIEGTGGVAAVRQMFMLVAKKVDAPSVTATGALAIR